MVRRSSGAREACDSSLLLRAVPDRRSTGQGQEATPAYVSALRRIVLRLQFRAGVLLAVLSQPREDEEQAPALRLVRHDDAQAQGDDSVLQQVLRCPCPRGPPEGLTRARRGGARLSVHGGQIAPEAEPRA